MSKASPKFLTKKFTNLVADKFFQHILYRIDLNPHVDGVPGHRHQGAAYFVLCKRVSAITGYPIPRDDRTKVSFKGTVSRLFYSEFFIILYIFSWSQK
jgi:hypothetical protein